MSTVNYETELNYIHRLSRINGYNKNIIDNILRKHLKKKHLSEMSTFFNIPKDSKSFQRIGMPLPLNYKKAVTFSKNMTLNMYLKVQKLLRLC